MNIKKLSLAGLFIALAVSLSGFFIPVGAAKCFPIQHMVNVLSGVILGPVYGVGVAFATSLIRVSMGTGSLLAFPGSMLGALMCGVLYMKSRKMTHAFLGEVVGTGLVGALASYPVAALLMGREVALFAFVIPFGVSSIAGSTISVLIIKALERTKVFQLIKM